MAPSQLDLFATETVTLVDPGPMLAVLEPRAPASADEQVWTRSRVPVSLHAVARWSEGGLNERESMLAALALAAELQVHFREHGSALASVTVTDNRRTLLTLRHRRDRASHELRVCRHLLSQPAEVVGAVVACLKTGRFPDELRAVIARVSESLEPSAVARPTLVQVGAVYDLAASRDRVSAWVPEHIGVIRELMVGWGGVSSRKRSRTIRLGTAMPERGLVRVHPALDRAYVPEHVVDMVVYHELCHCIAPPLTRASAQRLGERRVHHSTFRALEARNPRLDEANRWVRAHIERLLRS